MAIYSLHHGAVGRTTHAAGTAGAHARYVTRPGAANDVVGEHMPLGRDAAGAWLNDQEAADRKNARVIDKVMLALPKELDHEQRVQLVRDFAAEVGGGRIPWLAGIHDGREDADNPHAHVIFRDRDIETGKRVAELSGKGSTERLRELWEVKANQALERAGSDARIDRRSLEDQGIAQEPGIHVGPNVRAMEEKGIRPVSIALEVNGRVVNWPEIDQGRTRADRQREIEAANDDSHDVAGDRGKDRGAPPVGATPAAPVLAPEDARQAWAKTLRELADQNQVLKAPGEAQGAPLASEPSTPSQNPAEAIRRRPEERERALATEKGRLSAAIERGWEKLTNLATRLDAAFQRILHRDQVQPGGNRLRLNHEPSQRKIEVEDYEAPSATMSEPSTPPSPLPPPSAPNEPQLGPTQPTLTPAQGLGKSLNHPLLRRRKQLDGPGLPSL